MMAADHKKPEHDTHAHAHADTHGQRTIEQIQLDLADVKAQLAEAHPVIESEAAKAARQLQKIAAAKVKWALTHEPDDPFDPSQFEPPMTPLKQDPKAQQTFHQLHYRIARLEGELAAATKAAITG